LVGLAADRSRRAARAVTIPILKEIKSQAPQAICEVAPTNVNRTLIINRETPAVAASNSADF
jgi:hypothetical protein